MASLSCPSPLNSLPVTPASTSFLSWNVGGGLTPPKLAFFYRLAASQARPAVAAFQELNSELRLSRAWHCITQSPPLPHHHRLCGLALHKAMWTRAGFNPIPTSVKHYSFGLVVRLSRPPTTPNVPAFKITIAVVHVSNSVPERTRAFTVLASLPHDECCIILGDFNAIMSTHDSLPPSAPCPSFSLLSNFSDPMRHFSSPDTPLFSRCPHGQTWRRLDYILCRHVRAAWAAYTPSPSDHFVAWASLFLPRISFGGRPPRRIPDHASTNGGAALARCWATIWESFPGPPLARWDSFKSAVVDFSISWCRSHPPSTDHFPDDAPPPPSLLRPMLGRLRLTKLRRPSTLL